MEINNRFLDIYNYLVDDGKITSKTDFAEKLGISNSMITDITKNRTKPGLNVIRNIVLRFPLINIEWLIAGVGKMLKNGYLGADTPTYSGALEVKDIDQETYTPAMKTPFVHPKSADFVHPTVHPTGKNVSPTVSPTPKTCPLCHEKERVITHLESRISELKDHIETLKAQALKTTKKNTNTG